MERVWIVGASGNVGTALMNLLDCTKYEIFATDKKEVDVTKKEDVHNYMVINRPDVIINCAGYTDVDACEENIDEAYRVNAIGPRNLAAHAQRIEAKIIQLSTDDVFDSESERPYNEFDTVHPKNIYGKSKYAGEEFVSNLCNRHIIIRSSWVYGTGNDFVHFVLDSIGKTDKLEIPVNTSAVPTSAKELARVVAEFIENECFGTYHVVCQGSCNRYEFAKEILKCAGKENELEIVPTNSKNGSRPAYSVLDNMMLRLDGMEEPMEWKAALNEYIQSLRSAK